MSVPASYGALDGHEPDPLPLQQRLNPLDGFSVLGEHDDGLPETNGAGDPISGRVHLRLTEEAAEVAGLDESLGGEGLLRRGERLSVRHATSKLGFEPVGEVLLCPLVLGRVLLPQCDGQGGAGLGGDLRHYVFEQASDHREGLPLGQVE